MLDTVMLSSLNVNYSIAQKSYADHVWDQMCLNEPMQESVKLNSYAISKAKGKIQFGKILILCMHACEL